MEIQLNTPITYKSTLWTLNLFIFYLLIYTSAKVIPG